MGYKTDFFDNTIVYPDYHKFFYYFVFGVWVMKHL